ncbi:MAG: ABC transporter permease [Bacilli bacterium]|nr:ABC transporter permease [Bacilli bacterium]
MSAFLFFNTVVPTAIATGIIFLFGCVGEIILEKAGHLNLGIPGIMCMGTLGGCLGVSLVMGAYMDAGAEPSWFVVILVSLVSSMAFAAVGGLIYAFLTVTLKCNQNVTGLALTTFGAGVTDFFMDMVDKTYFTKASNLISTPIVAKNSMGPAGNIFLSHGFFVYFGIAVAIIAFFVLKKTKVGLSLRAVGENPATADAAGINVTAYKYGAIITGSSIAGIGGLYYVMDYIAGSWNNSSTVQGFGWLAIALVIFAVWNPALAMAGSLVFGFFYILPSFISGISFAVMKSFDIVPYVIPILVLIGASVIGGRGIQPPASLGLSYFREDR